MWQRSLPVALDQQDRHVEVFQDVEQAQRGGVFDRHRNAGPDQGVEQRIDRVVAAVGGKEGARLIRPARPHGRLQLRQDAHPLIAVEALGPSAVRERRTERRQQRHVGLGDRQIEDARPVVSAAHMPFGPRGEPVGPDPGAIAAPTFDDLVASQVAPGRRDGGRTDPQRIGDVAYRRQLGADRQHAVTDQGRRFARDAMRRAVAEPTGEPFRVEIGHRPSELMFNNVITFDRSMLNI